MSGLTLVHQDDALHIHWHEDHGYVLADWQPAFRKGEVLKRSYQACIDAARKYRGAPWLADVSRAAVLDPADQKWISEWFWPEFSKAGVPHQAVVQPHREVGKMSAQKAAKGIVRSGIEVSVHQTRAQAEAALIAWLDKHASH
jgi:hypothetical protein